MHNKKNFIWIFFTVHFLPNSYGKGPNFRLFLIRAIGPNFPEQSGIALLRVLSVNDYYGSCCKRKFWSALFVRDFTVAGS